MTLQMPVAISPCPNDTFAFHAWFHRLIPSQITPSPVLADIQTLNEQALKKTYPVSKISLSILSQLIDDYILLPVGAALGKNCGPKLIAKTPFDLSSISSKTIAIPGIHTTAHLLLSSLLPSPFKKVFCHYHEIVPKIQKGEVDAGLIIHETRFTFLNQGLIEIVDLGEVFERKFCCNIPLGGIIAKRKLGNKILQEITKNIQNSLKQALENPDSSLDYLLSNSQEKDMSAVKQHINLYVTKETYCLSQEGIQSIDCLLSLSRKNPNSSLYTKPWLFNDF